jgi:sugar-specific transcriptional regulator TrmB
MSQSLWKTIGLTDKEADIYDLLIRKGEVLAATIIKESGLKRATVYKSLYALEKKGLVSKRDIKKKIHFRPESPDKLLSYAEEQIKLQERAKLDIQAMLPNLTSSYILSVEKPVVSIFEGVKGMQDVFDDINKTQTDILLYRSVYDDQHPELDTLIQKQIKQQVKLGIHTRTITPLAKQTKEVFTKYDEKNLVTRHIVDSHLLSLPSQILIYGEKVAIISLKNNIVATVINHPDIAETFKKLFELLWIKTEVDHEQIINNWKS